MPTLKDLKCSIELSESQRALQEFGTTYGDGCVETFVPVPSKPQAFSIHLTSDKFIAPGISMYVFVDGVYQCNRNRQDLKLRKSSDSRSVVDFRVRQKEEKQKDGSMIAREWKFEKLNTTSADEAPDACSPNFLDNIGCIEVLILRCAGPRNAKTISAMSLDGSGDIPPPPFGFDGQPRTPNIRSVYDDRVPFFGGGSNNHGPPPPISSYRSPYAETVRSHETLHRGHRNRHILNNNKISPFAGSGQHRTHSRFSEPISPGARPPPSIPSEAFQYGSGPIPPGPMMGSERSFYHNRPTTAVAANAPGVDPAWLSEMLTTAVKRGVEEARRVEPAASETQEQHVMNVKTSSQPPGAWPQSPYAPDAPQTVQFPDAGGGYHDTEEYGGATWGSPEGEWSNSQAKEKSKAHVSWDTESKWESQTNAGGWNGVEETASDTWDSDKTLEARKPDIRRAGKWNTSRAPTIRSRFDERASSPLTTRTRQSHRSSEGHRSRRTRSKSHPRSSRRDEKYSSSSKDCDGWNRVEASSGSLASSELTDEREQRPRSRSHTHNSRNRSQSRRRSHRTQSAHGEERRPSRYDRGGGSETTSKRRNSMSMASGISPSVMQAPLPTQQSAYQPQFQARSVNYAEPTATIPKTHLGWVPAPSETYHKPSFAASNALPGHFSVNGEALDHRGSSTSWDNSKEKKWGKEKTAKSMNSQYDGIPAARDSWGSGNDHQQPGWDAEGDNGWEGKTTGDDLKNGWQVTEKGNKPKGAWGVTEEQQTGWATDENGWEAKDLENADKKVPGGWDAGFSGTSAQYPPWATTTSSPKDVQWSTKPSPTNKKLPKPSPPSKRHTSKSLSKYRTPSSAHPKPHWQFPPPPSSDQLPSTTSTLPPLPLPKISSARASAKGVEHQVQLGSGSQYGHVVGRPEYLDSLEKPYAVFRFKYRSRGVLGKMFGEEEVREHGRTKATEAREREKLGALGREELIGEMVRLKMGGGKASRATESVARDLTENWVKRHSRDPSERGEEKGWRDPNRWS